ncbi:MAG: phosphopantothenoylcysteine decarboxylase domain-containing protein [Thermogutta sp.]
MAKVLITSGPTREYLDPVRYLSNASSGRMGQALAEVFLEHGHQVFIVSGPVEIQYPPGASVTTVTTTEEMLKACEKLFPECDGVIGAAAPCDYRPSTYSPEKLGKSGKPLVLQLVETPDILAALGQKKQHRWIVGFALETHAIQDRAMEKLRKKRCDLIVINQPAAIGAAVSQVQIADIHGTILGSWTESKKGIAQRLYAIIAERFLSSS